MKGEDKNQICNGGRRAENGMRDNYRFILPARTSHFKVCEQDRLHT
jgi:hypothetical protein